MNVNHFRDVNQFRDNRVKRPLQKLNITCPSCGPVLCDDLSCPSCKRTINVRKCHRFTEKGVDVKLAITLLLDAIHDKYDVAFLISGDADYAPAIDYVVKQLKKEVVYCHFPSPKTSKLLQVCTETRLITKEMVEKSES